MVNLFTAAICQISTVLLGVSLRVKDRNEYKMNRLILELRRLAPTRRDVTAAEYTNTSFWRDIENAYAPIKVNILPKGDCFKCCPIDDDTDMRYLLYTRENPAVAEQIFSYRELPSNTKFNSSRPTVIYLHGFTEIAPGQSGTDIRDAYLSTGDYNIILVDWGALIALPWYISAVRNTIHAGTVLARFVSWLDTRGVQPRTLHVVGFSLGAEAAGLAGKELATRGLRIGRITGLDPAFPLYNLMGRRGRLSKGDAIFVDVIHTNSGVFGYPTPIGDVDFYPNWGSPIQPGCLPQDIIRRRILDQLLGCSHRRAWQLYAESVINPTGFPARRCKGGTCKKTPVAYMGIAADPSLRGQFYLGTNAEEPYAKNAP